MGASSFCSSAARLRLFRARRPLTITVSKNNTTTAPSAKGKGEKVLCSLPPFPALAPPPFCVLFDEFAVTGVRLGPVFCVADGVLPLTIVGVVVIAVALGLEVASAVGVIVTDIIGIAVAVG